ncbi:hypothetical protein [Halalkalibacillus halophilus]|uniref:hypothetical protein n=1 Tax=Halalkalibacillus halophilus TaxID=392827 RepID=UPI000411B785|nr:hypothetical protein [Halalkalibacillus halophilus]
MEEIQLLTFLFVIRGVVQNGVKAWMVNTYGVDGYDQVLIYMQVTGWILSGVLIAGFVFVGHKVNTFSSNQA